MNGPGSTNTLIIAVVVFLVVSLGAAVFFWWRSMYGVWSVKRRQHASNPHTTADGSPIIIIPGVYDARPTAHTGQSGADSAPRAHDAAPMHTTDHHRSATDGHTPWPTPDHAGHHGGGAGGDGT